MDLESITRIREFRDSIRSQIKSVNKKDNEGISYGDENEYSFRGLIGGIDSLMTDISTLTKAPKKFVKISTHNERAQIINYLEKIDGHFTSPEDYITEFEDLKILLRGYNVRNFSDRQLEFEKELESTLRLKLKFEEEIESLKTLKEEVEEKITSLQETHDASDKKLSEINTEIDSLIEQKNNLIQETNNLTGKIDEFNTIKEEADGSLEEISTLLTESKSNEKLINSFASRVQEREKKLDELEQATDENNSKLDKYEEERKDILQGAQALINSAKDALKFKTAEGISASFQHQYNNSKKWWNFAGWIGGALLCLLIAIGIGIWIIEGSNDQISIIISRVSLLPLPIVGAVFCANQFVKQKNIIEDYAYKMVLSKAIVGFSEQLKKNGSEDNEEYIHYIKTTLNEIHKDPLRKREKPKTKNSSDFKELIEVAEKIVKISKPE